MRGLRDKMRYQMEFNAKQGWFVRGHVLKAKGEKRIGQEAVEGGKGKCTVSRKGLTPNSFW